MAQQPKPAPDHRDRRDRRDERAATETSLRDDLERVRAILHEYIVQREAAEEALRQSEERYRSLIQHAAFGIYRLTPEGRFIEVNAALVTMLGYATPDEVLALDPARDLFLPPVDRATALDALRDGASDQWVEVRWRKRDGTPITVRLAPRAVRGRDGAVQYLEGIAEDVTERQRRDELLRRSERMASLGATLAGAAHELNNPLAAVIGFAQILLRTRKSAEDRAALETIYREATRAAKIIRDLLTFARRHGSEGREPLDVNEVVRYIISTRRYALETRGVRVELALGEALPPVAANRAQLEQVVLNLVVNAEQALGPAVDAPRARAGGGEGGGGGAGGGRRGTLTVRTGASAGGVVLEVADDGPGIAPEDLPRIWDPFFTTKQEGEGTGLGLSVVHGIVASHGGTIDVASALGAGTRFTIHLPSLAGACDAGEPAVDAAGGGERAATPLDILVVDDEEAILRFLERYLTSRGHAVLTAPDGAAALRLAAGTTFDVVVCDVRMPGMDGFEVVRRLRALPDGARTRYVLSTGADVAGAIPRADDLGVAAVVPKPYDIELLRRAIEEG